MDTFVAACVHRRRDIEIGMASLNGAVCVAGWDYQGGIEFRVSSTRRGATVNVVTGDV